MGEVSPVLEGVEPSGDTLDPPLSMLVGVKDKLDGRLHLELLLQGKEMLLPGTPTLGEQHHLPTRIYLEMRGEPENWALLLYKPKDRRTKSGDLQKQLQFSA